MNWLDENFPDEQRAMLVRWRIPHRRVGHEVGWLGAQDTDIIPLLHGTRGVTFFTLDEDFFQPRLCHGAYCLVWLDVAADDLVGQVRRFLRHPEFQTERRRMGTVVRVHHDGVTCWQVGVTGLRRFAWPEV